MIVGITEGVIVGFIVGVIVGIMVGITEGFTVGITVGIAEGTFVGTIVGIIVGNLVGAIVGENVVGFTDGLNDIEGFNVGAAEGLPKIIANTLSPKLLFTLIRLSKRMSKQIKSLCGCIPID